MSTSSDRSGLGSFINHYTSKCLFLQLYYYHIFLGIFDKNDFNVHPAPAANRSIGVPPSRLHCGRTASYGSIIVPNSRLGGMQEPPAYCYSWFCLPGRRIGAQRKWNVPVLDYSIVKVRLQHRDAFTGKHVRKIRNMAIPKKFSKKCSGPKSGASLSDNELADF